jgi:hypothetical protein
MATSFRGNLYRRPDFAIMGTDIPERLRRPRPPWTDNPPIVPPADPNNPFGDPPRFHEVDPPEQNPYNDPVYRPFIVTENLSGQTDGEPVGGWPGMLLRATMQQGQVQPRTDSVSMPNDASEHNSDSHGNLQGGLLGRLLSLQAEQSQYQPTSGDNDQAPFVSPDPNFRQLARIPNTVQPMPLPPQPEASASHMQAQDEADQAQQARDAAAARLVRGVRSVHRAEGPEPDPIDIAKLAGIGLVNGGVNLVGLLQIYSEPSAPTI